MKVTTLVVAALLLTAPVGIAAPQLVANPPYPDDLQARVRAEMKRGTEKLMGHMLKVQAKRPDVSNSFGMEHVARILLAVFAGGASADDPDIVSVYKTLTEMETKHAGCAGWLMVAIAARHEPLRDPFAPDEVDADGRHPTPPLRRELDEFDRRWLESGVKALEANQHEHLGLPEGPKSLESLATPKGWGSKKANVVDPYETGHALLGLDAAARCGVTVPTQVWESALSLLLRAQAPTGPEQTLRANELRGDQRAVWTVSTRSRIFGTEVGQWNKAIGDPIALGTIGLLLCQRWLFDGTTRGSPADVKCRQAICDALAWLQSNFDVRNEPGEYPGLGVNDWRAELCWIGVLTHMRHIGDHDWYADGTSRILAERAKRKPPESDLVSLSDDAAEAADLLFLSRGGPFNPMSPLAPINAIK